MRDAYARVLSQPVRVHWAGFETDTYTLQQNGWSLSADQDVARQTLRLAMKHEGQGLYGLTEIAQWEYCSFDDLYFMSRQRSFPILQMRHVARNIHFQTTGHLDWNFQAIDARPTFVETEIKSLEDLAHFAPALVRTQEIILPEETVPDLMKRILEMQEPGRQENLKRKLRSAQDPDYVALAGPRQKFHAQILSIAS